MKYAHEIIVKRLKENQELRIAHMKEIIDCIFEREVRTACIMIRDLINATMGFKELGLKINKSDKAIMTMLNGKTTPNTKNIFSIINEILEYDNLKRNTNIIVKKYA